MFVRPVSVFLVATCVFGVACGSSGGGSGEGADTAAVADVPGGDVPLSDLPDVAPYDSAGIDTVAVDVPKVDKAPKLTITKPALNAVAIVGTPIAFEAQVSDDVDDPTALTLVWTTNLSTSTLHTGKPNSGGIDAFTTTDLPAGAQIVQAKVIDSAGNSSVAAVKITVDSLPGAPVVAILPEHPTTTDALTAVILQDAVDADRGPTELKYSYSWWKNGSATVFTGPKMLGYIAKKGEMWSVHVSAVDPYAGTGPEGTAQVVIDDSAPPTPTVAIVPAVADLASTVTCTVVDQPKDADGDKLSYTYTWTVGTYVVPGATTQKIDVATLTASIDGALMHAGDELRCSATASDGQKASGTAQSSAIVLGAAAICASAKNPCSLAASCTDTDTIVPICSCNPGFVGDGKTCADIDECLDNAAGCALASNCTNTEGSFTCTCKDGYSGDGKSCTDIDECASDAPVCDVHATCANSLGGFACTCATGWGGDGKTCADIDECLGNAAGCDLAATCTNTEGSFTCTCKEGYDGDGKVCIAPSCTDNKMNGNETDKDCGGGCPGCDDGLICKQGGDCAHGFCNGDFRCVSCLGATDCGGEDTVCRWRTCTAGVCGFDVAGVGTVLKAQTPGDCQKAVCGEGGVISSIPLDTDLPATTNTCAPATCTDGVAGSTNVDAGVKCGADSSEYCDGNGKCVACLFANQCPGSDDACQWRTCEAGACGVAFATKGTVVSNTTPDDCLQTVCDGFGKLKDAPLDSEVPSDSNDCTADSCSSGVAVFAPLELGAACGIEGTWHCDGASACVECNSGSDCSGTDSECAQRKCSDSACIWVYPAAGTALAGQISGDCREATCDGEGGETWVPLPGDVTADGNMCTKDTCNAGSPVFVPINEKACDDNNACTNSDSCVAGVCEGLPFDCVGDQCQVSSGCDPTSGCQFSPLENGSRCDDNSVCTLLDACAAGVCIGSEDWGCTVPEVVATLPESGTAAVLESTPIGLTFNVPMELASLGAQDLSGACTGTVQVSGDDFGNCLGLDTAGLALSPDKKTLTFSAAPGLSFGSSYKVRVTTAATSVNGLSLAQDFTLASAFTTRSAADASMPTWNETGLPGEIDYCIVQFPPSIVAYSYWSPMIFARVYQTGVTEPLGPSQQITAQVGWGPLTSNPEWQDGWVWSNAYPNTSCPDCGNNDEYMASIAVPNAGVTKAAQGASVPPLLYGDYRYGARFSLDGGASWTYCDSDGAGRNPGLDFQTWKLPTLTVGMPQG